MSHPLQMPGYQGRLALASQKSLYPAYYQGPNIGEGIVSPSSVRDTFAVAGYLIRKPRVVRVVVAQGSATDAERDYYVASGPFLAADPVLSANNVAVTWGSPVPNQGTAAFWRASEGGNGAQGDLNENWIVQTARPGPLGQDPATIMAGSIYLLVFQTDASNLGVLNEPGFYDPIGANYLASYNSLAAMLSRFEQVRVQWYHQYFDEEDFTSRVEDMVSGSNSFAGIGLDVLNFNLTVTDLFGSHVPYSDLLPDIKTFFGL